MSSTTIRFTTFGVTKQPHHFDANVVYEQCRSSQHRSQIGTWNRPTANTQEAASEISQVIPSDANDIPNQLTG